MTDVRSIAMICHPYDRGGVTVWMIAATKELLTRGHSVYFVTVEPKGEFSSGAGRSKMVELLRKIQDEKFHLISARVGYEFELGTSEYRSLLYSRLLKNAVPSGVPVIVSDDEAVWRASAMNTLKNPMIAVMHSDDGHYYRLYEKYKRNIAAAVAVSRRVASKSKSENTVNVIPCGIEWEGFSQTRGEPVNPLKLCWVGRVEEEQKRVSDIVSIAELLKVKYGDFILNVAGSGPQYQWLEEQLRHKGLTDQVRLLGWVDGPGVKALLRSSDILLQTSNYEGMSIAVMEALASGCAVVSSRVSGVEDLENDSRFASCVFLYEIGDVQSAVTQIQRANSIDYNTRMNAAQKAAKEVYSIASCIDRYLEVINKNAVAQLSYRLEGSESLLILKSKILSLMRILKLKLLSGWSK